MFLSRRKRRRRMIHNALFAAECAALVAFADLVFLILTVLFI